MRSRAVLHALADPRMAASGYTPSYNLNAVGITDLNSLRLHLLAHLYGTLRTDRAITTESCRTGPPSFAALAREADRRAPSPDLAHVSRARGTALLRLARRVWVERTIGLPVELPESVALGALAWCDGTAPEEADALAVYAGVVGPVWAAVRLYGVDPVDAAALIVDLCAAAPPPALPGRIPEGAVDSPLVRACNDLTARRQGRRSVS